MKKYFPLLIALVAVVFIAACSKKHDPAPIELKAISLGRDTLTLITGQTFQLDLKVTPTDYDESLIRMTSSDTTVLTTTNSGKLTAKKAGISIIKATNDKQTISITCLVNVVPKTVIDSLKVGLLLYLPFNNSGVDSSGNGNHGIIHEITSIPDRFGTANSAYYFNGLTSFVKINDAPALRLSNTSFTLNAWVKLDDYNSSYGDNILSKHFTGADNGWAWGITGNAYFMPGVLTFGPGGGSANARGTIVNDTGKWHMVTAVYNRNSQQVTLYVDGVFDGMTGNIPPPSASVNANMYIGRDNPEVPTNGYMIHGAIDDVRIYQRTLNLHEIHKLFVAVK